MPDVEIKRKSRLSREEAGRRLIAIGTALSEGPKAEVEFDGDSIHFVVADDLEWEFELEVDGTETELEIELKWSDPKVAQPQRPAKATRARAKS
jgi:amphi-Trp domain-containing protein